MTGTKPLVSVVVPVFNNQTRLKFALDSIINQDYDNLEIILVNDASTDNSRIIAEKTLRECKRKFTIIDHEKNHGVSAARNTGLRASGGEFIWFCDGDDTAEKYLVSMLMNLILTYKCDIAFGGLRAKYEDGRADSLLPIELSASQPLTGETAAYLRTFVKGVFPHLCATIFKRELLINKSILFYEGCTFFEDIEFQTKAFCSADNGVAFTPECIYIYQRHSEMGSVRDSNTREKKLKRWTDEAYARIRTAEYLSQHVRDPKIKFLVDNSYVPECTIRHLTILSRAHDRGRFDSILQDEDTRKILKRAYKTFFRKPEIAIKAFTLLHMPGLYFKLRKQV